jgi:hypothetical protein
MATKALEQCRDLATGFLQTLRQVSVLKAGVVELPAQQSLKHIHIIVCEQVKAS